MNGGHAEFGKQDDWTVDLDEIIGTNLYGITIRKSEFILRASGFSRERILQFQCFVEGQRGQGSFHFHEAFEGKFEAVVDEGLLALRIAHKGVFGSNIVEIMIGSAERASLAAALAHAIEDEGFSQ